MPKVDSNNFISNQFQENIVENKQNSISKGTEENKQSNKSKIENKTIIAYFFIFVKHFPSTKYDKSVFKSSNINTFKIKILYII